MSTLTNAVENRTAGATQWHRMVDVGHLSPPRRPVRRKLAARFAALALMAAPLLLTLGCGTNPAHGGSAGAGSSAVPVQFANAPTTCDEGRGQMASIGSACVGDVPIDPTPEAAQGLGSAADALTVADVGRFGVRVSILETPASCDEGRGQMASIGSACAGDVPIDPSLGWAADPLAIAGAAR